MVSDFRKQWGQSFNYFKKLTVSRTTFGDPNDGYRPDISPTFNTSGFTYLMETGTGAIEYSFNGIDVHGEMDSTLASKSLSFIERSVNRMWFRVKVGSSGTFTIRVEAWGSVAG